MKSPVGSRRIGVLSDTHGRLAARVFELFEGVELILHAGDIGRDELLCELEALAPVMAVSGNVDGVPDPRLRPLERRIETPAGRVGLTHGHLACAPTSQPAEMVAHFRPFDPAIIIFGHSHIPHLSQMDGVWLFNPGAAGSARFGRAPTVGLISVTAGGELTFEHLPLD